MEEKEEGEEEEEEEKKGGGAADDWGRWKFDLDAKTIMDLILYQTTAVFMP